MSRFLCAFFIAAASFGASARAEIIAEETGASNGGGGNTVYATSWTQTGSYQNVAIAADLFGGAVTGVTAWLTTDIGPGATSATQIATTPVVLSNPQAETTLFSGLDLGPGTYYLVVSIASGPNPVGWYGTLAPNPVTAPGVTLEPSNFGPFLSFPDYGPSAAFVSSSVASLRFSVTTNAAAVPEPSSLAMAAIAAGLLACARHRRGRARAATRA